MLRRLGTVRMRTTIAATLIVAVALAASSLALVLTLRSTMTENLDDALAVRAADIGSTLEADELPDSLAVEGEEDGFVQIVDSSGNVVMSSANVRGDGPISDSPSGTYREVQVEALDGDFFRVTVQRPSASSDYSVVVGRSLEDVESTTETLALWLAVGIPVLVGLVAVTTWIVIGRALRPVEAIRAEVADIGGSDLHRRVPEPASNDEIGRLAETMNEMLDRLEAASDRQKRFVSDAAHELRTPLATVGHEIEVAQSDLSTDRATFLAEVADENRRMGQLVDDLLLLARSDQEHAAAERAVAHLTVVDLDDLALVEAHRRRATSVTIDVSGLVEASVYGDSDQLARVMRNLLDNAVRHAEQRVSISIALAGSRTCLVVDDDGAGVDPADRQLIFERFARVDDGRSRDAGGTGLGLAIARELVDSHGGTIEVTESPDLGGARFTVSLPNRVS